MNGYYDLSCKPATFDFAIWLSICKNLGVKHITFDKSKGFQVKKFPLPVAEKMYRDVLIPLAEYWGMTWSEGTEKGLCPGYRNQDLLDFPNFKPVEFELGDGPPTVTLRDSIRNKHRDSNKSAWLEFAKEINAIVIEDAYVKPISVKDRYDLYRNSRMNYFCSNGPGAALFGTNIPYTFFSPDSGKGTWGTTEGFQFPWAKNQKIVWANDTIENLRAVRP